MNPVTTVRFRPFLVRGMLLPLLWIYLLAGVPARAEIGFDLRWDRLVAAIGLLPEGDRPSVDQAIALIKKGEHGAALLRLSELNRSSPSNSSLRMLTAYAMLQAGNLLGALQEAEQAHEAPNGNSYKCWLYSKIALLTGKPELCRRELDHVKKVGDLPKEAKSLEQELNRETSKGKQKKG
jgi:hypothetical protein